MLPRLTAELFYNYTEFVAAVSICKHTPQVHCNTEMLNDQTVTHAYVKQLIFSNTNIKTTSFSKAASIFTGSCDPIKIYIAYLLIQVSL